MSSFNACPLAGFSPGERDDLVLPVVAVGLPIAAGAAAGFAARALGALLAGLAGLASVEGGVEVVFLAIVPKFSEFA